MNSPATVVPLIKTYANMDLRWGEWLGIALTGTLATSVALETLFIAGATAWFGDPGRALLPLGPLVVAIMVAALIMRFTETVPTLQRLVGITSGLGTALTALILIRLRVFPQTAPGDLSWLSALGTIINIYAEQPHTIVGLILMSILIWSLGRGLARFGGDYEKRRAHLLGVFVVLLVALFIAANVATDRAQLNAQLILAVPTYTLLGLITLGQVRLAEVRERIRQTGGDQRTLLLWRVTTGGLAALTLIPLYLAVAIFDTRAYDGPLSVVRAIYDFGVDVVLAILNLPITLLFTVVTPLLNLIQPHPNAASNPACITPTPGLGPTPTPNPVGGSACVPPTTRSLFRQVPPPTNADLHLVYAIILGIGLVIGLIFLLRRLGKQLAGEGGDSFAETRETIPLAERRSPTPAPGTVTAEITAPPPGSVRFVYRQFLQVGVAEGYGHQRDETPAEYARRLQNLEVVQQPVAQLTMDYEEERYGAVSSNPSRFARAQGALRAILAAWSRHQGTNGV